MDLENDFYIAPLMRSRVQKITLLENETSAIEAAKNTIKQYKQREDWDEPFYVCDLQIVVDQYKRWMHELPNVKPYYAVKSCPLTPLISTLAAIGCGFDCASKNEINHVLSCGVEADRIIYANPTKLVSHLCHARKNDVKMMTFDNMDELFKVKKHFPEAKLLIRLFVDDAAATTNFSIKFGATVEHSKELILKAKELNLNIIGIAYHCGSGNPDVESYRKANAQARELFDFAKTCGFNFNHLDIGGGFPGSTEDNEVLSLETMAKVIRESFKEHFPHSSGVKIVSEPGRYFGGQSLSLLTCIHGKKKTEGGMSYHIADGVFNSFAEVFYRDESPYDQPIPLIETTDRNMDAAKENNADRQIFQTTVFGPTCDGIDVITRNARVPEMQVGEWLLWKDMGCYSTTLAIGFNGFQTCKAKYFISREKWAELQKMCEYASLLPEVIN